MLHMKQVLERTKSPNFFIFRSVVITLNSEISGSRSGEYEV
jgi:hypothetical protein